jgi:hypothetical protein
MRPRSESVYVYSGDYCNLFCKRSLTFFIVCVYLEDYSMFCKHSLIFFIVSVCLFRWLFNLFSKHSLIFFIVCVYSEYFSNCFVNETSSFSSLMCVYSQDYQSALYTKPWLSRAEIRPVWIGRYTEAQMGNTSYVFFHLCTGYIWYGQKYSLCSVCQTIIWEVLFCSNLLRVHWWIGLRDSKDSSLSTLHVLWSMWCCSITKSKTQILICSFKHILFWLSSLQMQLSNFHHSSYT